MHHLNTLAAVCLISLTLSAEGQIAQRSQQPTKEATKPAWTTFTSPDNVFSVLLPEKPEPLIETFKDPRFKGSAKSHRFVTFEGRRIYVVAFTDYPGDYKPEPEFELNNSRAVFLEKLNAKLTSNRRIEFQRAPGDVLPAEEFSAVDRKKAEYQALTIFDGKRPIQLMAGMPQGESASAGEDVKRFFSSFSLGPQQP